MKKNICCSVNEETFANLQKARFILLAKKKTLSSELAKIINRYAKEYDENFGKNEE